MHAESLPRHPGERRAKIVCTIGPASNSEAMIRDLVRAGMDVARLNFSHGTHDDHAAVIARIRKVASEEQRPICVLQDLQGPKIRTGKLANGKPAVLTTGARIVLTPEEIVGDASRISVSLETLPAEVKEGARILVSDGLIELRVLSVRQREVECEVVNGGVLRESQGVNLPGVALSIPSMTEKDRSDLEFGLQQGVDLVALSFVRCPQDVAEIKAAIRALGKETPVVAKLEKPQALEHLEEIFELADAVMVARGDLGVEVPPEEVPIIQKRIIAMGAQCRKPVITATQMLESMVESPRPTRAEASDVANAIFDGTDAVMLSGETARGKYPREAVEMMARIICSAEAHMEGTRPDRPSPGRRLSIAETICNSVARAADDLDMKAIAVFTESGATARLVSKYRPRCPVYAFGDTPAVCNRMNLYWGVHPVLTASPTSAEQMVHSAEGELIRKGLVTAGDIVGVVTGTRLASGFTNVMRLHTIGSEPDVRSRQLR